MLFSLPKMPIGMETYLPQANPVTLGPNPYPGSDTLADLLCNLVALRNNSFGPTPVVTHSGDVSRLQVGTDHFHGLKATNKGGRSSAAITDEEVRQEIEFRQEPEADNSAEIQVSVPNACERGFGRHWTNYSRKTDREAETVSA